CIYYGESIQLLESSCTPRTSLTFPPFLSLLLVGRLTTSRNTPPRIHLFINPLPFPFVKQFLQTRSVVRIPDPPDEIALLCQNKEHPAMRLEGRHRDDAGVLEPGKIRLLLLVFHLQVHLQRSVVGGSCTGNVQEMLDQIVRVERVEDAVGPHDLNVVGIRE
ncbi:hypothetical protein K466DRAFT_632954, partial [Polyporus arcularius HHB13444]